jgi:uncharacterized protein
MKWLLALLLVVAALWWLQRGRLRSHAQTQRKPPRQGPQVMRACARCGVHMAEQDMVQGLRGHYCGDEHLRQSGDRGAHE